MFVEAAVILEYCPLEDDIPLSASQTGEIGLVCGDQQSVSGRLRRNGVAAILLMEKLKCPFPMTNSTH